MRSTVSATIFTAFSALCACAPGPHAAKPVAAPPQQPAPPADASYDWHVLLAAPFGSALKAVPLNLHEVLLFRDETRAGVPADEPECYAPDRPAPRFLGSAPSEYLVCFRQDRLSRIQASVALASGDASRVFAAACTLWLKNAADSGAAAAPIPPAGGECEGWDAAVHFRGRLTQDADGAQWHVSIVLDVAAEGP